MQSSAGVFLRALLMLGCLVAIPLIALCGSSLPQTLSFLLEGRWPTCVKPDSPPQPVEPGFEPISPAAPLQVLPAEPMLPKWQSDPLKVVPVWPDPQLDPSPGVTPASYESTGADPLSRVDSPAARGPATTPTSYVQRDTASAPRDVPRAAYLSPQEQSVYASGGDERFRQIQARLRQLGATYCVLESGGALRDNYRFFCKMATGGNASFARNFEATDADPLQAMAQVLQQVEGWRAGW